MRTLDFSTRLQKSLHFVHSVSSALVDTEAGKMQSSECWAADRSSRRGGSRNPLTFGADDSHTPPMSNDAQLRSGPRNLSWAIFGISVLSLFLELLLIRWVGTEIRIFAYLQNTVLGVCFLGLGIGAFTSRRPSHLVHTLVPLSVLLGLMAIPATRRMLTAISGQLSALGGVVIWYGRREKRRAGWSRASVEV